MNAEYGDKGVLPYCVHPGNVPGTDIVDWDTIPEESKQPTSLTPYQFHLSM